MIAKVIISHFREEFDFVGSFYRQVSDLSVFWLLRIQRTTLLLGWYPTTAGEREKATRPTSYLIWVSSGKKSTKATIGFQLKIKVFTFTIIVSQLLLEKRDNKQYWRNHFRGTILWPLRFFSTLFIYWHRLNDFFPCFCSPLTCFQSPFFAHAQVTRKESGRERGSIPFQEWTAQCNAARNRENFFPLTWWLEQVDRRTSL